MLEITFSMQSKPFELSLTHLWKAVPMTSKSPRKVLLSFLLSFGVVATEPGFSKLGVGVRFDIG